MCRTNLVPISYLAYMTKILITYILWTISYLYVSALSVQADVTNFTCKLTTVNFTFDCEFSGQVWVPVAPPAGITYSNAPSTTAPYWDVVDGKINFDIDVDNAGNSGSWNINFLVISSSDTTCAMPIIDNASINMTYDCLMPPNDNCSLAIPLNVSFGSCSILNFDTNNTSFSGINTSCHNFNWVDLWYSFTANNNTITLEYASNPGILAYYTIFSDCPSNGGSELSCVQIINSNGQPGAVNISIPTIGQQYYLQTSFNSSENGTDQSFCLHSATVPAPCPSQITVSDAGPDLPNNSYTASDFIQTSGSAVVSLPGVIYDAVSYVELNAGFACDSEFEIKLDGCIP